MPCRLCVPGTWSRKGSCGSDQCSAGEQMSLRDELVDIVWGWTLGHTSIPPPGDLS